MENLKSYKQEGNLALKSFEAYDNSEEYTVENRTSLQEQYYEYLNDIRRAVPMDQEDFCTAFMYA